MVGASTIVIAEHEKKYDPGDQYQGLSRYRVIVQGDAALSFYRSTGKRQSSETGD
jgi:hypothetical protein